MSRSSRNRDRLPGALGAPLRSPLSDPLRNPLGGPVPGVAPPPATQTAAVALMQQIVSTPQAMADTYGLGEVIEIQITFDTPVTVTGLPSIPCNLGQSPSGSPEQFAYARGSGTTELVFVWPVAATDEDTNGIFVYGGQRAADNSIVLNGGTITSLGDTPANLTLPTGGGTQSGHKVDGSLMPAMMTRGFSAGFSMGYA